MVAWCAFVGAVSVHGNSFLEGARVAWKPGKTAHGAGSPSKRIHSRVGDRRKNTTERGDAIAFVLRPQRWMVQCWWPPRVGPWVYGSACFAACVSLRQGLAPRLGPVVCFMEARTGTAKSYPSAKGVRGIFFCPLGFLNARLREPLILPAHLQFYHFRVLGTSKARRFYRESHTRTEDPA